MENAVIISEEPVVEPKTALQRLQWATLFDANKELGVRYPTLDDETQQDAVRVGIMLEMAEMRRSGYRAIQAALVVQAAREQIWLEHPPTDDYPNGIPTLLDFLKSYGLKSTTLWDLNRLGTHVVPFCDAHGLEIDHLLTENNYPKLAEALSALTRAASGLHIISGEELDESAAVEVAEQILEDVEKVDKRDNVRELWRKHRPRVGSASTYALADGRAVVTVLLKDASTREQIVGALQGQVDWDLVFTVTKRPNSIAVTIDDPRQDVGGG